MQQWYRTSLVALVVTMFNPVQAELPPTIIWAVGELPGVYQLDNPQSSPRLAGPIGELQNYLFAPLAEDFHIQPVSMLIPRMQRELQSNDNVCTGILYRNAEREAYLHFSQPYMIIPTPQITLTQRGWDLLGQPQALSLADLVKNPELQGLRVSNRTYGRYADSQLDSAATPPITVTGSLNAVRMLAGGRADYLIEYPIVVANTLGQRSDTLHFAAIERTPPFVEVGIACSKSDLGAAFIAAIDERLPALVGDPNYQALNLELAPTHMQPGLMQLYQQKISAPKP